MAKTSRLLSFMTCMLVAGLSYGAISAQQALRWSQAKTAISAMPKPFMALPADQPVHRLFTIHGSNTVGESLAPSMVVSYLEAKGAKNVRLSPLDYVNESVVRGYVADSALTVEVAIAAHGSSTGYTSLVNGMADIWASSRAVKHKEAQAVQGFANLRHRASEHILGIDGLAMIVHPSNPVSELSKEQLGLVYSGQITNWSQLGGPNMMITLFARDDNSGTWDSFKNMVLGQRFQLNASARRFESSEHLVNSVLNDNGGIGFIGMAFVGQSKLLAISDGPAQAFKPTQLTVATEDYALSRRLYFYTHGEPSNRYVDEFIAFSQGITGQSIVRSEGFISQNVESMTPAPLHNMPATYSDMVEGAKRLSVNFRFQKGSAQLDNKALRDIQRLAYFMRQQSPSAQLLLIGFGDKRKDQNRSKLLSKLRAMAVKRELSRLGVYSHKTTGYGDFNPIAAFEGASKTKNRRVEVWLR